MIKQKKGLKQDLPPKWYFVRSNGGSRVIYAPLMGIAGYKADPKTEK